MFEKITGLGDNCVSSAPDILKGTAEQNKALFDRSANVIVTAFNKLVDELGDIETALDGIISIQNSLTGGDA